MNFIEVLEGVMLICFSVSWYWSIAKMLRAKVASGKSLIFVAMICVGYLFGISSKLLAWQDGGELSVLIWVYGWNFVITVLDAALVVHYSARKDVPEEILPVAEARAQA